MLPACTAYVDKSIASLSAGQAAGTTAILPEVGMRTSLVIQPPADCYLSITSGLTTGYKLFGGVPNMIAQGACPRNQLFISGLSAAVRVEIWEG